MAEREKPQRSKRKRAFPLRPARKRTWAPEGQTPVLKFNFNWNKLSDISGVSLAGGCFEPHEGSITSQEVIGFLRHLRSRIGKPLRIVWDGLRADWSREVWEYVDGHHGGILLEHWPAYAQELNAAW